MQAIRIDGHFHPIENAFPCVLCLGNFDGVHAAHAALAAKAAELAAQLGVTPGAFCFYRPSGDYLQKSAPPHLTSTHQKLSLLFEAGAEFALVASFPDLRELSPGEFIAFLESHGCVGVVCGFNFRFAKGAAGNAEALLAHFGAERTVILPPQMLEDTRISSSAIRELITSGNVQKAARMLGHPWSLTAKIHHGKHLGSSWGFPTANQYFPPQSVIPAHGVYAVRCTVDGKTYDGVGNVGLRPTVDGHGARINCETYLFDFEGDLYGKVVRTDFYAFLRPEQKFESTDALRAAIARDTQTAHAYFDNLN